VNRVVALLRPALKATIFLAALGLYAPPLLANHPLGETWPNCPSQHAAGQYSVEYSMVDSNGNAIHDGDIVEGNVGVTIHLVGKALGGYCENWLRDEPGGECSMVSRWDQNVANMEVHLDVSPFVVGRIGLVNWTDTNRSQVMDTHATNTTGPTTWTVAGDAYPYSLYLFRFRMTAETTPCGLSPGPTEKTMAVFAVPVEQKNLGCPRTSAEEPSIVVGNPCHTKIGNKLQVEKDIEGKVLPVTRYYNSGLMKDMFGLGHGWTTSYHRQLEQLSATVVRARRGDGGAERFTKVSGMWQQEGDSTAALMEDMLGFTLVTEDKVTERYDLSGRLQSQTDRNGNVTTYSRDALTGHITGVSDPYGNTLSFYYIGGSISQIMHSSGASVSYSYDDKSNLTSATYADGTSRTYHYEDPSYVYALTGITDEKGIRFGTYSYDSKGRVISSEHSGGVGSYDLTFNADGTTVVTDPLGQSRTYTFVTKRNVPKISSIAGAPCDSCGGASFIYDTNGNMTKRTDFNGNVTRYVYNTRNLETSRTEAYGTALARTITTAWHATYPLPTQIDEPGRRTTYTYDANGSRLTETVADTATSESRTTTWTYTTAGLVDTINGPRTDLVDVTDYDYDAQGNLIRITDALGHIRKWGGRGIQLRQFELSPLRNREPDLLWRRGLHIGERF
jgi:YD repeat-containing protein